MGGIPENRGKAGQIAHIVRARSSCPDWSQASQVAA